MGLSAFLLVLAQADGVAPAPPRVEPLAVVENVALRELSGLARTERAGVFWGLNDSGGEPRLYAFAEDGTTVGNPAGVLVEGATNVDWEELAVAGRFLVAADLGNNGNARRDLALYLIEEATVERASVPARRVPVHYPDQRAFPAETWHFDCEAVFGDGEALWFLTKHRRRGEPFGFERGTKLYRLSLRDLAKPQGQGPGRSTSDDQNADPSSLELTLVETSALLSAPTAAALSPDGARLAVATYREVLVFPAPEAREAGSWLSGTPERFPLPWLETRQVEALAWRNEDSLILANEGGRLFRLRLP